MNILKRMPPFSSFWIRKCINNHFSKILRPNCYIIEISTSIADRFDCGWSVYVKATHPGGGWTNGNICVLDDGKVVGRLISQEKFCFDADIIAEVLEIIK